MFWRFNYLTSDIDNLLDKEDVTLHEILNEDDVLQECKAQNKKLVDFLVRPSNLEELVSFVVKNPSEEVEEKMKYKYPNIACELLTSDVNQITEALVTSGPLLDTVMKFLDSDDQLNPLQASFFGKVVGLLITRKGELVVDFLKSHDQFLGRVLHHLGTSAIMDLLLRLLTSLEPVECRTACVAWIQEQQLVQQLVSMIDPTHPAERNFNAAQALCDLICISREQLTQLSDSPQQQDALLTEIESQETVSLLLTHMFDAGEIVESVITSGLQVIQTLLEYRRVGPEGNLEQMIQADMERFSLGIHNTINAIVPRISDFHKLLLEPPRQHYVPMPWTVGVLDRPLGNTRLQTVRLIATLLSANVSAVSEELARLGTLNILLDLYFEFAWNNFLHRQVEICLSMIVLNDSPDSTLLTQVITEFKLLEKVVKGFADNQKQQSTPGGHRLGYMGHLTRVANSLVNNTVNSKKEKSTDDLILSLPADVQQSWEQFKVGPLADINKINNSELVGSAITSSSEIDEFGRIAFPQDGSQKIGRTARLFGFNEDDLNGGDDDNSLPFGEQRLSFSPSGANNGDAAAMFEDACNRRVFDQSDTTDEDMWVEKEITFSPTALESTPSPTTTTTTRVNVESSSTGGSTTATTKSHMVVSDNADSDDNEDEDERERRLRQRSSSSDEDSDEEDREIPESRRRIHQQPAGVAVIGTGEVRASAEEMDISSSDDWARFDDMMDVTPAGSAQPLPWETGSATAATADKIFSSVVDTSSSSANDSWANFAASNSTDDATSFGPSSNDDGNWADFTGFGCSGSGQQRSSFESVLPSSSTSAPDGGMSSRTAAYLVSSSSDVDASDSHHVVVSNSTEACSSAVGSSESSSGFEPCFTNLDICSSSGAPGEVRSGDGPSSLTAAASTTENGPS